MKRKLQTCIDILFHEFKNLVLITAHHLQEQQRCKKNDHQVLAYQLACATAELLIVENGNQYVKKSTCTDLESTMLAFFLAESLSRFRGEISARASHLDLKQEKIAKLYRKDIQQALAVALNPDNIDLIAERALDEQFGQLLYNQDEQQLQEMFQNFSREIISPVAELVHRQNKLAPKTLLQALSDMGAFGINIPEAYGGSMDEFGKKGMMIITEELSRVSLALGGSMIVRPEILVTALLHGGSEEQKQYWLPKIASGEIMNSIAVTEPDFGSDVANIIFQAKKTNEPEAGYLLNGVKTWCTFAQYSNILLVLARTESDPNLKHRGLTLFIAEKPRYTEDRFVYQQEMGGKLTGSAIPTIGYRGMHSFELSFENYFVPAKNKIGEHGQGFYLQMTGFSHGRLQTAARVVGVMQAALDASIAYSKQRKVFGKTIDQYPMTRWKIARMSSWTQLIRQYVHSLSLAKSESKSNLDPLPKSTFIKFYAARMSEWITREAQQLHGGMGYAEEYPVSRYFLDSRVFSIFEGVEEVLALKVCARALLKSSAEGSLEQKIFS